MVSNFDTVDSIVHYLRDTTITPSAVDSTDSNFSLDNNQSKSSIRQRKGKEPKNEISINPDPLTVPSKELSGQYIQVLPKGRVKYGPVTVNPRKQPSKTLYTGRRSKYEVLSGDEEEKRRDRRDRNRIAATKCREKRENILSKLENEYKCESDNNKQLLEFVHDLQEEKRRLEFMLADHLNECRLNNSFESPIQSSMIFGDPSFLSTINDTSPPPLPLPSYQQTINYTDDEELSNILVPTPVLTNSAYSTDCSNSMLLSQQQLQEIPTISMTNSSIERLINNLQTPIVSMESSNNHSMLFNSAVGSSCAKQHSNSSDDDSLQSKNTNPYVY